MDEVTGAGYRMANGTQMFGEQAFYHLQNWGPRIIAALLILLVGWLVARGVKWGIASLVNKTPLARRANQPGVAAKHPSTIGAQVGEAAFWVVMLLAIFLAAQPLGLAGATGPAADMLRGFGEAVPNIIGAALIMFLGYVLASVAKKAVEAVLTASHIESLSRKVGARVPADPGTLPRLLGSIVFALIIIPVAIAALDTLAIAAISEPATAMLRIILDAIPHVIAAGIILALAYVLGKFASNLLTQFLATTGFDRTIGSLGLFPKGQGTRPAPASPVMDEALAADIQAENMPITPSKAVGSIVFIAIVVFGLMEAFRQLNFTYGSLIMAQILALFGQVLFGSIIIGAAVLIAKFVERAILAGGGTGAKLGAVLARVAIIVLGLAIGLRFMGLADDIITLAFGLVLGSLAVGAAIAIGLGGREPMREWLQKLGNKAEAEMAKPAVAPVSMPAPTDTP